MSDTQKHKIRTAIKALPDYSVLMSVCEKDEPNWFGTALESILNQSWPPFEIIIIEDGPVPDSITNLEKQYMEKHAGTIRIYPRPERKGLAEAMRYGVDQCRTSWIARMDADDISDPARCEKELKAALETGADIVGCDCEEFIGSIDHPVAKRLFPAEHEQLIRFSRRRTPFCHPAVMMKKEAVLNAGNYKNIYLLEDYDLFDRMLANGSVGYTVKEILFHVRVGDDFYGRRGGWKYVKTLLSFNLHLLKINWTAPLDCFVRSCGNMAVGLAPRKVRTWMYRRLLRK